MINQRRGQNSDIKTLLRVQPPPQTLKEIERLHSFYTLCSTHTHSHTLLSSIQWVTTITDFVDVLTCLHGIQKSFTICIRFNSSALSFSVHSITIQLCLLNLLSWLRLCSHNITWVVKKKNRLKGLTHLTEGRGSQVKQNLLLEDPPQAF